MKILKFTLILITIISIPDIFSQNIETLRSQAYNLKLEGNNDKAIANYELILSKNPNDYDSKLALGRLYFTENKYEKATAYYRKIYTEDKTDVEALKGLGDCALMTNKYKAAISYFQLAIKNNSTFIPAYFQLAKTYSWQGNLNKAITTYKEILAIDKTYSEAFQGIGKMYYWKNKPYTALRYYKKALVLDPNENPIIDEYENIKNQIKYEIGGKFIILNETEEDYTINAIIQQYEISKRFSDNFEVKLNTLFDYSNRDFTKTEVGDTLRWYNNAFVKLSYITHHHRLDAYGGFTASDKKMSSYGLHWKADYNIGNVNITNSLTGGYDYFYYWNNVGQHKISNTTSFSFKGIGLSASYNFGIIDSVKIADVPNAKYYVDFNQYNGFDVSVSYKLFSKPLMKLAANYAYLNYQYKSALYYSPMGRNLVGPSALIYYPFGKFYTYGSFSYNYGKEFYYEDINNVVSKNYIDVSNWSAEAEFGYNLKALSLSLGASNFYNAYYTNYRIFIAAKIRL